MLVTTRTLGVASHPWSPETLIPIQRCMLSFIPPSNPLYLLKLIHCVLWHSISVKSKIYSWKNNFSMAKTNHYLCVKSPFAFLFKRKPKSPLITLFPLQLSWPFSRSCSSHHQAERMAMCPHCSSYSFPAETSFQFPRTSTFVTMPSDPNYTLYYILLVTLIYPFPGHSFHLL